MNLAEYQQRFKIRRIDFNKVRRTEIDETYADDKMVCPYCGCEIEYEAEDTGEVIKGMTYQCPECDKWFRAEGEVTVNVTCAPMEDAVINNRYNIERSYEHINECEKRGMEFPDRQSGFVEWETYYEWAKPLFENQEGEEDA